jgi:hypothetical protein
MIALSMFIPKTKKYWRILLLVALPPVLFVDTSKLKEVLPQRALGPVEVSRELGHSPYLLTQTWHIVGRQRT